MGIQRQGYVFRKKIGANSISAEIEAGMVCFPYLFYHITSCLPADNRHRNHSWNVSGTIFSTSTLIHGLMALTHSDAVAAST